MICQHHSVHYRYYTFCTMRSLYVCRKFSTIPAKIWIIQTAINSRHGRHTSVVSSPPVLTKSLSNMRSHRRILLRENRTLFRNSSLVLKPCVGVAGTFCSSQQISLLVDRTCNQTDASLLRSCSKPRRRYMLAGLHNNYSTEFQRRSSADDDKPEWRV